MKKFYLSLLLLLFSCTILFAVPVSPNNYFEDVLPNGDTIRLKVCGDEYCSWLETTDGYVVIKSNSGEYKYATIENNQIACSDINFGEKTRIAAINKKKILEIINTNRNKSILIQDSLAKLENEIERADKVSNLQIPLNFSFAKGNQKVLCILIGFPDRPFTTDPFVFNTLWNSLSYTANGNLGSVNKYYKENSCNQLNVKATVVGPYTASHNHDYYKTTISNGLPVDNSNSKELIKEAITAAKNDVNFSDFDLNGDFAVDLVHVVCAGQGMENSTLNGTVWSHYGSLPTAVFQGIRRAKKYICTSEIYSILSPYPTIGTICHEYGHFIGAPDFYDVSSSTQQYPGTGFWDVMCSGSHNNQGKCPPHHNPYTKCYIYEWCLPTILSSTEQDYTLAPSSNSNTYLRIDTNTEGEFFLLENKARLAFNNSRLFPAGGNLLIYHIHRDIEDSIAQNRVNTSHPQQCYIVSSNATTNPNNSASSYCSNGIIESYPGTSTNNTFFTSTSIPSAVSWSGSPIGVNLCYITRDSNDIQFTVNPSITGPYLVSDQETYSVPPIPSSATINWTYTASDITPNIYTGYQPISFVNGSTGTTVTVQRNYAYVVNPQHTGVTKVYYTGNINLTATITDGGQTYSTHKSIRIGGDNPAQSPERQVSSEDAQSQNSTNTYQIKSKATYETHVLDVSLVQMINENEVPYEGTYTLELWSLMQPYTTNLKQITTTGSTSIDISGICSGYYQIIAYINGSNVATKKVLIP